MGQGRELDGSIRVQGSAGSHAGGFAVVALVRDRDGNVRHDDIHNVSQDVLNSPNFTAKDLAHLIKLRG